MALVAAELSAWTPAGELARLGATEPDEFPDEQMAPDDSLAFDPARDVAPCSDSQGLADALREQAELQELAAIRAAGIVAEPAGFRERA